MYFSNNSRCILRKVRFLSPNILTKIDKNLSVKKPKDDPTKPPLRINIPEDKPEKDDSSHILTKSKNPSGSSSLNATFQDDVFRRSDEIPFPDVDGILLNNKVEPPLKVTPESYTDRVSYTHKAINSGKLDLKTNTSDGVSFDNLNNNNNFTFASKKDEPFGGKYEEPVHEKSWYILVDMQPKNKRPETPKKAGKLNSDSSWHRQNSLQSLSRPKAKRVESLLQKSKHLSKSVNKLAKKPSRFEVHEMEDEATYILYLRLNKQLKKRQCDVGCVPEKEFSIRASSNREDGYLLSSRKNSDSDKGKKRPKSRKSDEIVISTDRNIKEPEMNAESSGQNKDWKKLKKDLFGDFGLIASDEVETYAEKPTKTPKVEATTAVSSNQTPTGTPQDKTKNKIELTKKNSMVNYEKPLPVTAPLIEEGQGYSLPQSEGETKGQKSTAAESNSQKQEQYAAYYNNQQQYSPTANKEKPSEVTAEQYAAGSNNRKQAELTAEQYTVAPNNENQPEVTAQQYSASFNNQNQAETTVATKNEVTAEQYTAASSNQKQPDSTTEQYNNQKQEEVAAQQYAASSDTHKQAEQYTGYCENQKQTEMATDQYAAASNKQKIPKMSDTQKQSDVASFHTQKKPDATEVPHTVVSKPKAAKQLTGSSKTGKQRDSLSQTETMTAKTKKQPKTSAVQQIVIPKIQKKTGTIRSGSETMPEKFKTVPSFQKGPKTPVVQQAIAPKAKKQSAEAIPGQAQKQPPIQVVPTPAEYATHEKQKVAEATPQQYEPQKQEKAAAKQYAPVSNTQTQPNVAGQYPSEQATSAQYAQREASQPCESPTEQNQPEEEKKYISIHDKDDDDDPEKGKGGRSPPNLWSASPREKPAPVKAASKDVTDFQTCNSYVTIGRTEAYPMTFSAAFPPLLKEALNIHLKLKKSFSEKWKNISQDENYKSEMRKYSENSILFPKAETEGIDCESLLTTKDQIILNIIKNEEETKPVETKPIVDSLTVMKKVKEMIQFDLDNAVKIFDDGNGEPVKELSSVVVSTINGWKVNRSELEAQIAMRKNEMKLMDLRNSILENENNPNLPKYLPGRKETETVMQLPNERQNSVIMFNPQKDEFYICKEALAEAISRKLNEPLSEVTESLNSLSKISKKAKDLKNGDSILVFDDETQSWKVDFSILEKRQQQLELEEELTKRSELILETFEELERNQMTSVPRPDTSDKKTFDYINKEWKDIKPEGEKTTKKYPFKESNAEEIRKKNSDLYENLFVAKKKEPRMDSVDKKKAPGVDTTDSKKESKDTGSGEKKEASSGGEIEASLVEKKERGLVEMKATSFGVKKEASSGEKKNASLIEMKASSSADKKDQSKDSAKTTNPPIKDPKTPEQSSKLPPAEKPVPKKDDGNFWETFLNMNILPKDIRDIPKLPPKPPSKPEPKKIESPSLKIHIPFSRRQPSKKETDTDAQESNKIKITPPPPPTGEKVIEKPVIKAPPPSNQISKEEPKKTEPPKTEPAKKFPKIEPPKPSPKTDPPKAEITKQAPKIDPPKPETTKQAPKIDPPKPETTKQAPKADPPKDTTKQSPKIDPPKAETTKQAPKVDPPKPEITKQAPKVDPPKAEITKQAPKADPPKDTTKQSPKIDPPKPEPPKLPKLDPPKNPPKTDPPKPEPPKQTPKRPTKTESVKSEPPPAKPGKTTGGKSAAPPSDHYVSDKIIEISRMKGKDQPKGLSKVETVKLNISPDTRQPSKVTEINLNKKSAKETQKTPPDNVKKEEMTKEKKKMYKNFEKYKNPYSDPEFEEKSMKIKSDIASNPNLKNLDNWNKTLVLQDIMKPPDNIETWLKDETDKMATLLLKILQEASDGKPKKKQSPAKPKAENQGKGNPYENIRKKQENTPESFLFRVRTVNLSLENEKKKQSEDIKFPIKPRTTTDAAKAVKAGNDVESMEKQAIQSATISSDVKSHELPVGFGERKEKNVPPWSGDGLGEYYFKEPVHQARLIVDVTEEIPGPEILKKISNFWKLLPMLDSQLTIFTLFRIHQLMNIGRSVLSTTSSERMTSNAFTKLFSKYGPIVNVKGLLSGNLILINKPEHLATVFDQDGSVLVRSVFDSVEYVRRDFDEKSTSVDATDWNSPEWFDLKRSTNDSFIKGCERYMGSAEINVESLIGMMRKNRNSQDLVSEDFMQEIKRWSLEGLCNVLFEKSFGFMEGRIPNTRWILEPDKLYSAVEKATYYLNKCENRFQLWRMMPTPSIAGLSQAYQVISSILSKQICQAGISLKNKNELLKDGNLFLVKDLTFVESMLLNDSSSIEDIHCNLADILLIGTNIINSTVGFLLYNLALNIRVQSKLFQELKEVLPTKTSHLDYKKLSSLKYLQACIRENLRLHTPVPLFNRQLQTDILLANYFIPKGTFVVMDNRVSNQQENIFEEPDRFSPERWLNEDKWMNDHESYSSFPLCHGPRGEFAKKIIELQLYTFIAKVLRNFQVEYHYGEIQSTKSLINFPDKPLKFNFIERES